MLMQQHPNFIYPPTIKIFSLYICKTMHMAEIPRTSVFLFPRHSRRNFMHSTGKSGVWRKRNVNSVKDRPMILFKRSEKLSLSFHGNSKERSALQPQQSRPHEHGMAFISSSESLQHREVYIIIRGTSSSPS